MKICHFRRYNSNSQWCLHTIKIEPKFVMPARARLKMSFGISLGMSHDYLFKWLWLWDVNLTEAGGHQSGWTAGRYSYIVARLVDSSGSAWQEIEAKCRRASFHEKVTSPPSPTQSEKIINRERWNVTLTKFEKVKIVAFEFMNEASSKSGYIFEQIWKFKRKMLWNLNWIDRKNELEILKSTSWEIQNSIIWNLKFMTTKFHEYWNSWNLFFTKTKTHEI